MVVVFSGPSANDCLSCAHAILGTLQDRGFAVALVTDGRMSGASGKVPAAIHISPEASAGGPLAFVHDGDLISIDVQTGSLECQVAEQEWSQRQRAEPTINSASGIGREYFGVFRQAVSSAEEGASVLWPSSGQGGVHGC